MILPADPKRNYIAHRQHIVSAIQRVLDGGWYILGQEVEAFEREFAAYIGVAHGIGVASGTDAVLLALRAAGVGAGDAVVTVSHTAVATVAAIELAGAIPVLVDVDPETFTMDVQALEAALELRPGVKAIVAVHLYGHPADMPRILEIASRYGAAVVEDCAQSHGASIEGRKTGAWGNVAAFSFYPTKNLGALGDGGAIVTNDAGIADRARILRQYGWRTRYVSDVAGLNSRLDEMQAAILRVKLPHLDIENNKRREIAARYDRALASSPLRLPVAKPNVHHVYHQYTVRYDRRDSLQAALKTAGVGTAVLYPQPVHRQGAYSGRLPQSNLVHTEKICREILCLPMHPHLRDDEVQTVIDAVLEAVR